MKNIWLLVLAAMVFAVSSCKTDSDDDTIGGNDCELAAISSTSNVMGYGILAQLPGIWNGPVTSGTPLGSYPEWVVDFRPIAAAQVSAKNELDSLNDIFMSFFIVKHDCEYKMAFRNGGGFAGLQRNSYMIIDSVSEGGGQDFYRFSDPVSGGKRVFTNVTFKQDSLIMTTYTNKYNTQQIPTLHMRWSATLRDTTSTQYAISLFDFPQKELVKDFSTTFDGLSEAVFYNPTPQDDPYPEQEQPHVGVSTVNVNIANPASPDAAKKVLIIITTQPLFNGVVFSPAQLDYRSRYVFLSAAATASYDFNYMHPGDYYVNALYDSNGDLNFSSGDYINSNFDQPLTLAKEGTATANVTINLQIP